MDITDFKSNEVIARCPGCGNFGILTAVKKTLAKLDKHPKDILLVSGIGRVQKCHWRDNRYTRGASTPVLSY